MKILIAYDGSGYSRNALSGLRYAGLPDKARVCVISISEVWLLPRAERTNNHTGIEKDFREYLQMHSEQVERNLIETEGLLVEAKELLQKYFPQWTIGIESAVGSPGQVILDKAKKFTPNLIVVGSLGLSSDATSGLGSVSRKVLFYSKIPVRIARGSVEDDGEAHRIAICFDNSPCSLETVKTVALRQWRQKPDVRLLVVTDPIIALIPGRVFQLIPGIPEGRMRGEEIWIESLTRNALRTLQNVGLTASVHILSGNPRIVLVNEAREWKADTLFIGANSEQSNFLGGVASEVAARASCTVEVLTKN